MDPDLPVAHSTTRRVARTRNERSEAAHGVDVLILIILLEYTKKDAVRVRGALKGPRDGFRNFRIAITCNGYENGLVRPEVFPFRDLRRAFPVQERLRQDLLGHRGASMASSI